MTESAPKTLPVPAATTPVCYGRARVLPALMIFAGTVFFIAVAADLHFHGRLAQADEAVAPYLHDHSQAPLILLASGISRTGGADIAVGIALIVTLFLFRRRRAWRAFFTLLTGLVGSAIINQVLKNYFAVPRPTRFTYYHFKPSEGPYSFPSGHTMTAAITLGLLILILAHLKPLRPAHRFLLALITALWTLIVGASLLYIGVHTLTDVLAALGLSLAWLGVLRAMLPPRAYDVPNPAP